MDRRSVLMAPFAGALTLAGGAKAAVASQTTSTAAKPKRLNKAIELLEEGQPVYFIVARGGYDEGKKLAQTWADAICYDMEHSPLDLTGLVGGGPTKSGHRTPTVVPQVPVGGLSEPIALANYWMLFQVLDMGAHGIYFCHAREPGAVQAMVQSTRYPFNNIGSEVGEGLRGSGGQSHAAQIWGIPVREYLRKADPWPLNPDGELLNAIKCEDKYALANCEKCCAVPGVGFVEWGPGDMGFSLDMPLAPEFGPVEMRRARARVLAAAKANHLAFLNSCNVDNVEEQIREGVMVFLGPEAAAEKGRRFTHRTMPW